MSNFRYQVIRLLPCLAAALAVVLAPAMAYAQDAAATSAPAQPAVPYASVSELNGILTQLQQTAKDMQVDLTKTRIEKWKTDNANKKQTLAGVDSIQRNLQSALPATIAELNNAPEDVGISFKLYRNLVVLYDSSLFSSGIGGSIRIQR